MDLAVKKKLENAFYNYEQNVKSAAEQSSAIDKGLVALYGGIKVKGSNANGRENAIIKAIEKECEIWRWCYVVEKTLEYFYIDGKTEFIRCRYFKRYDDTLTCRTCHISRATYYRWVDEVLFIAKKWAQEFRLI